jgi:hypothetical protein
MNVVKRFTSHLGRQQFFGQFCMIGCGSSFLFSSLSLKAVTD